MEQTVVERAKSSGGDFDESEGQVNEIISGTCGTRKNWRGSNPRKWIRKWGVFSKWYMIVCYKTVISV